MNSALLMMVLALVAGGILGAIFFGGLWWTTRLGLSSGQPALWLFVSLLVRTGIVLAGFYIASGSHWERLVACVLGFVMAHVAASWWARPSRESTAGHAP